MEPIVVSWSGGKDSTLVLKKLQASEEYEVAGLFTAFAGENKMVNFHYTTYDLIQAQADALGIPLYPVWLSENAKNEEYEKKHYELFREISKEGISTVAFGDIFLESIRDYRDRMLREAGINGEYPLWKLDPGKLVREFVNSGYKAVLTAVDILQLDRAYLFRELNEDLLSAFPEAVDLCGENGEYHSFVYDGPGFKYPVRIRGGDEYQRDFRPGAEMCLQVCEPVLAG